MELLDAPVPDEELDGVAELELEAPDGLELPATIGVDTLVGSVIPVQAAASAAGALTSSSRKLRRAVNSIWPGRAPGSAPLFGLCSSLISVRLHGSSTRFVQSHRLR